MSVRNCLPAEGSLAPALTVPTYTREQIKKAIRFDVNSPNSIPRDWVAAACRRAAENATCPVYELQKEHGLLLPPSFWAVERYGRTERPYAGIAATAIARWNG